MPTLGELQAKFASAATEKTASAGAPPARNHQPAATGGDTTKIASGGGSDMQTLQDIYLAMAGMDHEKQASAAAGAPITQSPPASTDDDTDFAVMAEKLAAAEADEQVAAGGDGSAEAGDDIIKIAGEYDSAGRIMARGFFDEFCKLAGNMDTQAALNQNTESLSEAKTPALGERGLPTMETNFAGSENHDQKIETAGTAPKDVYKDSLAPKKTISAGQGTGDDPEAQAISMGGGSPVAFATVRDLQA